MAMNRVVLEYPKGVSLNVEVVDASGQPTRTVELSQPVLIRLGPGLEFLSVSSGNIKTLLNISGSDSDEEEDDDDGNGDSIEDMTGVREPRMVGMSQPWTCSWGMRPWT